MPDWYKIRAEIDAGAGTVQELAHHFNVVPETINTAFRRMPDGKEQRRQMHENMANRLTEPPAPEPALPPGAALRLQELAPHYDDIPAHPELAELAAELLRSGVSRRTLANATGRALHVVQGWAAQGGHISETLIAQHIEIREALDCGAATLQEIGDLIGVSGERVRQILHTMPDMKEIYERLGVTKRRPRERPTPVQETIMPEPEAPQLTKAQRERLIHVIDRGRAVQRNAPPAARRALTVRDEYVRKLIAEGFSMKDLAEAAGVKVDSIRDWSSPAKTYRRQLVTQSIARKQRAKRRS